MGRLFGTDGVRGIANKDLTNELAMKIGMAAAEILMKNKDEDNKPKVWMLFQLALCLLLRLLILSESIIVMQAL